MAKKVKDEQPAEVEETTADEKNPADKVGAIHEGHAAYLKDRFGVDVDPLHIFMIYSTRVDYRKNSDFYQEAKAKREADAAAALEAKEKAKEERAAAAAEKKAEKEKAKAEKAEKAAAEKAEKEKAKADEKAKSEPKVTKSSTDKAPAKKTAAKKTTAATKGKKPF